jgi:hypothetical protein
MNRLHTILFAVATLAACATGVTEQEMQDSIRGVKLPHSTPPDRATLYVVRPSANFRGELEIVHIEGRSRNAFRLYGQEYFWTTVDAGPLQLCLDGNGAEGAGLCLKLDIAPGEARFVELAISNQTGSRKSFMLELSPLEGTYALKDLVLVRQSPPR